MGQEEFWHGQEPGDGDRDRSWLGKAANISPPWHLSCMLRLAGKADKRNKIMLQIAQGMECLAVRKCLASCGRHKKPLSVLLQYSSVKLRVTGRGVNKERFQQRVCKVK